MIRIGNFEISCDSYSYIVKEMGRVETKDSKNLGREYAKNTTYHMNSAQVVDKLLEAGLQKFIDTSDFGAVLAYMQNVKAKVKAITQIKK